MRARSCWCRTATCTTCRSRPCTTAGAGSSNATRWARLQARPPRPLRRALVVGVGGAGLPQVATEVAAVAAAFGAGATLLAEAQATRAAVLAGAADAELLHLACHGRFRADSPAFSELRLHDGPLTLLDLGHARLGADLVTLSACDTGISRVAPGGELRGLVRACMLAGARNVLATLWPVQDEASARLMGDFYRGLRAGNAPAVSLHAAQRAAAAGGAHPWLWAGHQLHGRG
jgi:CHAT domain-containing protein